MDPPEGSSSGAHPGLDLPGWSTSGGLGTLDDLNVLQQGSGELGDSPGRRGRKRDAEAAEQDTFESLLFQLGSADGAQMLDGGPGDNLASEPGPAEPRAPASKPSAMAARNKASRERQRRERLNDWWAPRTGLAQHGAWCAGRSRGR